MRYEEFGKLIHSNVLLILAIIIIHFTENILNLIICYILGCMISVLYNPSSTIYLRKSKSPGGQRNWLIPNKSQICEKKTSKGTRERTVRYFYETDSNLRKLKNK